MKEQRGHSRMLHVAASHCKESAAAMIDPMVEAGENVNVLIRNGSPLHAVARVRTCVFAPALFKHGADINAWSDSRGSPLETCCTHPLDQGRSRHGTIGVLSRFGAD